MPHFPRPGLALVSWRSSRPLTWLLVLVSWLAGPARPARAGTVAWFTNEAAFMSSLTGTSFVNDLGGVPAPPVSSPLAFSGSGYAYEARAQGGLYRVFNGPYGLTPNELAEPLRFGSFSGITAFGGNFSLTDFDEARAAGTISLSLYAGPSQTLLSSTTATVSVTGPTFLGLVYFYAQAPITAVSLAATDQSLFPTAERVIVGVPEPSALAGAIGGIALLFAAFRTRRRRVAAPGRPGGNHIRRC